MKARLLYTMLVIVAAMMLAACGGDSDSDSTDTGTTTEAPATETTDGGGDTEAPAGDAQVIELGVDGDNLAFDKTELTAEAGTVTIKLTNPSSIPHDVVVEGFEDQGSELVSNGDETETTVELEPGTYTFFCTPHKAAGMVGTLTIT